MSKFGERSKVRSIQHCHLGAWYSSSTLIVDRRLAYVPSATSGPSSNEVTTTSECDAYMKGFRAWGVEGRSKSHSKKREERTRKRRERERERDIEQRDKNDDFNERLKPARR